MRTPTPADARGHDAQSDRERARLRALVARLSDAELAAPMPDGWTVAGVLAHAAFWDARVVAWLDRWEAGGTPDWEHGNVTWINDAAKPLCLALPARDAARLALDLAEQADARVRGLSQETLELVRAAGPPWNLSRAIHRKEHLDEIERQLATGRG